MTVADDAERMSDNPDDHSMTLWEHLGELRSRLVKMLLAFLIGAGLAWFYREQILLWLTQPFVAAWAQSVHSGEASLNFPSPHALFFAYVRLSATCGLVVALPAILYQIWAFVAPGLYSKEKRFAFPFVLCSCLLFGLGGWFGWRFALTVAFRYLLGFSGSVGELEVKPTVMVHEYVEFVTDMLLAFGFAAELPVVVFFLSIAGIITHKHLIRFFRYFIVLAFVIAAVLTPPDPISQLMLAIPLCLLYGFSIGVAFVFSRPKARK